MNKASSEKGFVSIKLFYRVSEIHGKFYAHSVSWHHNEEGKLEERHDPPVELSKEQYEREKFNEYNMASSLNQIEERSYSERLKGIPSRTIYRQLEQWQELKRKTPRILPGLFLRFTAEYRAIDLIDSEIKRRITQNLDSVEPQRRAPKSTKQEIPKKRFPYGKLTEKLQEFIRRDGCKPGETVPSAKIHMWVRELAKQGYKTSAGSIRAILTKLGYTIERRKKEK